MWCVDVRVSASVRVRGACVCACGGVLPVVLSTIVEIKSKDAFCVLLHLLKSSPLYLIAGQ